MWGGTALNEDREAMNLIARMISVNPADRQTLDELMADPFIQKHSHQLSTADAQ